MTMRIEKKEGDFRGIALSQRCYTCLHKQEQEEKTGIKRNPGWILENGTVLNHILSQVNWT